EADMPERHVAHGLVDLEAILDGLVFARQHEDEIHDPPPLAALPYFEALCAKKWGWCNHPDHRLGENFGRSNPAEHRNGVEDCDDEASPQGCSREGEPGKEDEGAAQKRDEQAVTARRVEAQDATARGSAGLVELPYRHADQTQENEGEERGRRPCPGHPVEERRVFHSRGSSSN